MVFRLTRPGQRVLPALHGLVEAILAVANDGKSVQDPRLEREVPLTGFLERLLRDPRRARRLAFLEKRVGQTLQGVSAGVARELRFLGAAGGESLLEMTDRGRIVSRHAGGLPEKVLDASRAHAARRHEPSGLQDGVERPRT